MQNSLKILVIDDCKSFAGWIALRLSQAGIGTVVCHSLKAAEPYIPYFDAEFAGAVIDKELGFDDGLQVLARLRRQSNLPLILATADGSQEAVLKARAAGADLVLEKPFSKEVLFNALGLHETNKCPPDRSEEIALRHSFVRHLVTALQTVDPAMSDQHILSLLHRLKGTSSLYGFTRISRRLKALYVDLRDRHLSRADIVLRLAELAKEIPENADMSLVQK